MHDEVARPASGPTTIEQFSEQLGLLRLAQGRPSYAEIASRIAGRRLFLGCTPERARIARSTVYDAFRPGRKRLDVALVREILIALDLDDASVEAWAQTARHATPGLVLDVATRREHLVDGGLTPERVTLGLAPSGMTPRPRSGRRIAMLLLACLLLNLFGREMVVVLGLPLYLDMAGTAVAAIMVGPWWGALVGLGTNSAGAALSGISSLPFALVNVAGALVWGYGVRRWGMGRTIPRFFSLNIIAAFVCSCAATPILVLYHGEIIHGSDSVIGNLVAILHVVTVGTFAGNLLISMVDKTISGVVALIVMESRVSRSPDLSSSRATLAGSGPAEAIDQNV